VKRGKGVGEAESRAMKVWSFQKSSPEKRTFEVENNGQKKN